MSAVPPAPVAAPAGPAEVTRVRAQTTGTAGRFLVHAREQHLVSDARPGAGGPGEAIQAGELLLASLASCGLSLVQKAALEGDVPAVLSGAQVEVSFERDPDDVTRYRYIRLVFTLSGVDPSTAQRLVSAFTGTCPIYNTLRRGGPIEAHARVG